MSLTHEQIDALEAGPELDLLVAKAIAVPAVVTDGVCYIGNSSLFQGDYITRLFRPSSDWNDAMAAAEKCLEQPWLILHEGRYWNVRKKISGVRHLESNEADYRVAPLASSTSGPLSICRAILKFAAEQP